MRKKVLKTCKDAACAFALAGLACSAASGDWISAAANVCTLAALVALAAATAAA